MSEDNLFMHQYAAFYWNDKICCSNSVTYPLLQWCKLSRDGFQYFLAGQTSDSCGQRGESSPRCSGQTAHQLSVQRSLEGGQSSERARFSKTTCMSSESKKKQYKNVGVNKKIRQTLLTLFLRVELTSSVSFSKSSASFKHLDVSNTAWSSYILQYCVKAEELIWEQGTFDLPNVGKSTVLFLKAVKRQHGSMDL